ncbi:MAG: AarF/UbiB family protein [Candidatus Melainabacteria bacterium]|nr:AarF/UbiB family protein [Candidatus Melainabacteria bacterium]
MMMMMSLQPNNNYLPNNPNVMPFKAMARKASVEEAEQPEAVADVEPEDELDKIKESLDKKKEAKALKNKEKAKAGRKKLFKQIAIGVGAVAGAVVTAGASLGAYWYFHNPKPAMTSQELIKLAGEVANYTQDEKSKLAERFKHLNLNLTAETKLNGFQKWWTGVTKATLMPKAQKDRVLEYLFKENGIWDFIANKETTFKKSMVNITGEVFTNKQEQQNVSLLGTLASNLETAKMKQGQNSNDAISGQDIVEWTIASPTQDKTGKNLAIECKIQRIPEDIFKAIGEVAEESAIENEAILSSNKAGINPESYLPGLKESVEETFNKYFTSKGLGVIKISELLDDQKARAGSVAKIFKVTATDGQDYAIKVIHPSIKTEYFPNILERYILDLQQKNPSWDYPTVVAEACKKIGNLAKETTVSEEMRAHQVFFENRKKGLGILQVHQALAHHSGPKSEVMLQEYIPDYTAIDERVGDSKEYVHSYEKRARAKIQVLFETICQAMNGMMHGDLHPGNVGFDENGTLRMIDFGKFIELTGETPKKVRALMIKLLKQDDDAAIQNAIRAIDPAIYDRLSTDPQQKALLAQLKKSPFSIIETLFKYHLLDDPAHNINSASITDAGKLNVANRISAGLEPHTRYHLSNPPSSLPNTPKSIVTRDPAFYNDSENVYKQLPYDFYTEDEVLKSFARDDRYIDQPTEFMDTYRDCSKVFLKALFQDNPKELENNPELEKLMMRRVLDKVAIYAPGQEMATRIVSTVTKGDGFGAGEFSQRVSGKVVKKLGVNQDNFFGQIMTMGANSYTNKTLDDILTIPELGSAYYKQERLAKSGMNQKA